MNRNLLALVVLTLTASSAYAAGEEQKQRGKGNDGNRQEMFAKMKQLHVDGIQSRITILQTALSCVNAATSHEQMKPCHDQERKSMESLRDKQKAAMESMKPDGHENH